LQFPPAIATLEVVRSCSELWYAHSNYMLAIGFL